MRNLKRVLSLALAVVMVIGMMVMTTSAAEATGFGDAAEITNVEAVDVMVALGVLEGDDLGNYNPTDILTREQAAKIICYMLMGKDNAEMLVGTSNFTDVAASRWSAPYIAYCDSLGVIAGNGDGTFNPTGELTGVAFAKMLLVALGYDATIEGYVNNSNWATNIGTDAMDAGLNVKGVTLDAALTRENAVQMAFQALDATMVYYDGGTNVTTSDGTTIIVDATRYTKGQGVYPDNTGIAGLQFRERFYEDLLVSVYDETAAFGRPSNIWTYFGEEIGAYAVAPTFTYTNKITNDPVKKAFEKALNGYTYEAGLAAAVDGNTGAAISDTDDIVALAGNGVLVEIYADRYKEIYAVVVVNTVVAQITEIDAEKKVVKLADVAGNWTIADVDEDHACIDALLGMEEYDYVLITGLTTDNTNYTVASVEVPEVVTGLVTKVDTDTGKEAVTVAGTSYKLANGETGVSSLTVNADAEQNLFLDSYGYAIYTTAVAGATTPDVIYVVDVYSGVNADGKVTNMIKGVLADGTVVTAEVDAIGDMKKADKATAATSVADAGKFLAYTYEIKQGKYDLTYANGDGTDIGVAINTDSTAITKDTKKNATHGKFYGEDVKFVFVNGTTGRVGKVVEGIAIDSTLANNTNDYVVYSLDAYGNYIVTTVFVKGDYADYSTNLIYFSTAITDSDTDVNCIGTKLSDDEKSTLYGFEVYLNGEDTVIYLAKDKSASAKSFYQYTIDEKSGAYVLGASAYTTGVDGDAAVSQNGITYVGGHYYIDSDCNTADLFVADDAVVVDATGVQGSNINTMAKLMKANQGGATTIALVYNAQAKVVTMVYVLTQA